MIGYYVHHHGLGHQQRALALARELAGTGERLTVLSSLAPPTGLGDVGWLRLPLDVTPGDADNPDVTAGGVLHWAPLRHEGLRARMAAVSAWLQAARPALLVCDVSQEVALLARLHGVPVLSVVQPGSRDDEPHRLGLRAATALCAFWPPEATGLLTGLPAEVRDRVVALGALAQGSVAARAPRTHAAGEPRPGRRRVVVLGGRGGAAWTRAEVDALRADCPDWTVTVAGPGGDWVEDPAALLRAADVVVVHAGQNAVAEVAAARVPAVVVPAPRPFDEQVAAAAVLDAGPWPAVALPRLAHPDWPALLSEVAALDGEGWRTWVDGGAAARFAELVRELAGPPHAVDPDAVEPVRAVVRRAQPVP